MKNIQAIYLWFVIATATTGAAVEPFRKDINPALRYYQSFLVAPDLPQADRDYLFTNEWRGQRLPERFGELLNRYDKQFRLVREAAAATEPCEWGIDMSPGPMTLLPQLARNKAVAQAAKLRAMWHLQQGNEPAARDDLIAAFALARNCSRDGTLISVLVQIAMEAIICNTVAENFYQFSPETLKQLVDGFDAAPRRGTVATSIATGEASFVDWFLSKIEQVQHDHPGDEAKIMAGIRELVISIEGEEDNTPQSLLSFWEQVTKATGGTSQGVIKALQDLRPFYEKAAVVLALPYSEYPQQIQRFIGELVKSPNPFARHLFPAVAKSRDKEFAALVGNAMVRAAVEYKLHGPAGLEKVTDPCGNGPFAFERFVFQGVDRGFKLTSALTGRGFPEALIFVEKDGPPFRVGWKNAGQAVSPTAGR